MNHNDNPDFNLQPVDEKTAVEVTEETAAETSKETSATVPDPAETKTEKIPAATPPKSRKGMLGWIVAIIAVAALIVVFVLDGRKPEEPDPAPTPSETEAPETGTPDAPVAGPDFAAAYAKYAPDTTVFTVNGTPVVWSEYYSWLFSVINDLAGNFGITDWNTSIGENLTAEDYILEAAQGQSCQYPMIYAKAESLGIQLDDADFAQIDAVTQSDIDLYFNGSKDAFLDQLASLYITEEYYRSMGGASFLYAKLFNHHFGEGGSKLTDEDVLSFLSDNGFMHAKHILFKTVDDAMQPLDEAVVAQKKADAEATLAELQALSSDELEAGFDKLMAEKSEDPGSRSYTDGYYFQPGTMVEAFETTTQQLADGELSGLVESPYGYHILYRPAMNPDDLFEFDADNAPITARYAAAANLFSNITAEWAQNLEIVYEPEFENLKLDELFAVG